MIRAKNIDSIADNWMVIPHNLGSNTYVNIVSGIPITRYNVAVNQAKFLLFILLFFVYNNGNITIL